MKKITIISGYYYPEDTAVGLYNTQMVEHLESKGYAVTVITGFPNYPQWKIWDSYKNRPKFYSENIDKTQIFRYKQYVPSKPTFFKRILLILDFTFGGFINLFKVKECDIVISVVPYTSSVLLGWILKKKTKAKLWNHIQDFEFDAALQTGISTNPGELKKTMFKVLFGIESFLFNRADINSTISFSMMDKLKTKTKKESFYFPNWIDISKMKVNDDVCHPYLDSTSFKILYSGNIGDKQDWEFFIEFSNALSNLDINLVVVGDGAKREWLCNEIQNLENVKYYPPVKYEELPNLLCSADLHVLFQKNNVVDSVMPSKLLGMMGSSKPSLITGNITSEVREVIENSKGGFYITDRNLDYCVEKVLKLIEEPKSVKNIGLNARKYVIKKYSAENVLGEFENAIALLLELNV